MNDKLSLGQITFGIFMLAISLLFYTLFSPFVEVHSFLKFPAVTIASIPSLAFFLSFGIAKSQP